MPSLRSPGAPLLSPKLEGIELEDRSGPPSSRAESDEELQRRISKTIEKPRPYASLVAAGAVRMGPWPQRPGVLSLASSSLVSYVSHMP